MPRSSSHTSHTSADDAAVRSIRDRAARAQRAYATRLRESLEAVRPLVEDGNADAIAVARAIEAELAHIAYGSAIVDE